MGILGKDAERVWDIVHFSVRVIVLVIVQSYHEIWDGWMVLFVHFSVHVSIHLSIYSSVHLLVVWV